MDKKIKEMMENYDNQTNTSVENEEAKAYCQGTDEQFGMLSIVRSAYLCKLLRSDV